MYFKLSTVVAMAALASAAPQVGPQGGGIPPLAQDSEPFAPPGGWDPSFGFESPSPSPSAASATPTSLAPFPGTPPAVPSPTPGGGLLPGILRRDTQGGNQGGSLIPGLLRRDPQGGGKGSIIPGILRRDEPAPAAVADPSDPAVQDPMSLTCFRLCLPEQWTCPQNMKSRKIGECWTCCMDPNTLAKEASASASPSPTPTPSASASASASPSPSPSAGPLDSLLKPLGLGKRQEEESDDSEAEE